MLEWSQTELAKQSGVSAPTIKLIEAGRVNSSPDTLGAIQICFENAGLEFLPQKGVRFRDDLLTVLTKESEQDNVYLRLLDDIYYTIRGTNREVLYSFIDQSLSPKEVIYKQRLIRNDGSPMRFLVRHGDTHLIYPLDEYRYLPKGYYINNPAIVYGNKFATIVKDNKKEEIEKVLIICDGHIAELKQKEFEIIWQYGAQPEKTTAENVYE